MFRNKNLATQISQPPTDCVTKLEFSPVGNYLSCSSWDGKTRIYEIQENGQSNGIAMLDHQKPVLASCWSADGQKVFSSGIDNQCKMMDMVTKQSLVVAQHSEAISAIAFTSDAGQASNLLITASWDKQAKVRIFIVLGL